ncbi:MAG: sulfatase [Verrucomicrobiota bacterium]
MRIRRFLLGALCLGSVVLVVADQPNILLVLSDDHSVPHLGAYGDENCIRLGLTPHLDRFAAEGMRFDRAYTSAPQCAPSRTAIFAGRSPVGLGATRFAQPARRETRFFTDVLRENGYWVGLDGRHQHLDGKTRDHSHVTELLVEMGVREEEFERRFDHFVRGVKTKGEELEKVDEMMEAALDKVPEGKPFFLYFGFSQPHRKWGDDHEGIDPARLALPPDWPDLPEIRLDYARYLSEVGDLDRGFGLIDSVLEKRGLKANTLVIFMGDNGEALLRGKGTLNTRGIHVPLLARWPGKIKPGSISDELVSGVDIAATILEAADLGAPPGMTGMSFLNELRGESFEGREYVFAERGWHAGPLVRTDGLDLSRSVTTRRFHFVYNAIPERIYSPVDMRKNLAWLKMQALNERGELSSLHERLYFRVPRPIFELYDLERDPFQLENLAGSRELRSVEEELRVALDKWMVRESDFLPLPSDVQRYSKVVTK